MTGPFVPVGILNPIRAVLGIPIADSTFSSNALEDEIRRAREQANILAEEVRVIEENSNERVKAANERVRKAKERLQNLLQKEPSSRVRIDPISALHRGAAEAIARGGEC